jgi:putative acetyltransferase
VPELTYLAVSPSRRGRGVGRQLVETFRDAIRDAGHSRFELSVDADNRDAARFYERLGFERVGEYDEFGTRHARYALALGTVAR